MSLLTQKPGLLRKWGACGCLLLAVAGSASLAQQSRVAIPVARPAVEGNRAPYDLVFAPDGKQAYVTESAEGAVAVIDVATARVTTHFRTGGEQPAGLAVTPDGAELLVANSYSGTVAILDAATGKQRAMLSLPGMPYGAAVTPDGKRAFVSVSQLDELAVVDLKTAAVLRRIPVGRRPRALEITPDGKTLAVGNLAGGSISVLNTETLAEEARVKLKGINVRGIAVTSDGASAYATLMPAFNGKPTDDPREVWHNLVQAVTLEGADSSVGEDQWMDFARVSGSTEVFGTPDQHDIVLDPAGRYAWVASAGRDVVTRITIKDRRRDAVWPISQIETVVGANPRGLALRPDGKQVWVANHLGNSISILDAGSSALVQTIALGKPSRVDPTIAGQYLFNNAQLTRAHRFTCNSCHPDGGADGLTWRFVHVKDRVNQRNSRDLRSGVIDTAPFRWSGVDAHLDAFIREEVTGLLGGPVPTPVQARALEAAVKAMRLPPNPYRTADQQLTPVAVQGRELFLGRAGCGTCHAGPRHGGTGRSAWIGTTPENRPLDVPHLTGVYDSAPYLHNGRAATLEHVFGRENPGGLHGKLHTLTAVEQQAVLRYLREL